MRCARTYYLMVLTFLLSCFSSPVSGLAAQFSFTGNLDSIFNYREHEIYLPYDSTVTVSLSWTGTTGPVTFEIYETGCSSTWDTWYDYAPPNGFTRTYPLAKGIYKLRIWYGGQGDYTLKGNYSGNDTPYDPEPNCSTDNVGVFVELPDISGHLGYGRSYYPDVTPPKDFCPNPNLCRLDLNDVFKFPNYYRDQSSFMVTVYLDGNLRPGMIDVLGTDLLVKSRIPGPQNGSTYGPFTLDFGTNYIHLYNINRDAYTNYENHGNYRILLHRGAYVYDAAVLEKKLECNETITIEATIRNDGPAPLHPNTFVDIYTHQKNNIDPSGNFQVRTIPNIPVGGLGPGQVKKVTRKIEVYCTIDWTMFEIVLELTDPRGKISPTYTVPVDVDPQSRAMVHILYLLLLGVD